LLWDLDVCSHIITLENKTYAFKREIRRR